MWSERNSVVSRLSTAGIPNNSKVKCRRWVLKPARLVNPERPRPILAIPDSSLSAGSIFVRQFLRGFDACSLPPGPIISIRKARFLAVFISEVFVSFHGFLDPEEIHAPNLNLVGGFE